MGDFNADLSKRSPFGSILCYFCHDNSFTIADKGYLPADTYTYVSSAWGTKYWLDHMVCTADAMSCVSKMAILYNCIHSDHHPVLFRLDCDIVPEYNTCVEAGNATKLKVHWDNLRPDQVREYTKCTNIELSQLIVPGGVRCRDPNCKSRIHQAEISEFHDSIICSLTACSQPLTVPNNRGIKQAIVPGWN